MAASGGVAAARRRPNIVFFMGEGLRADEFGFMGNRLLKTPNMDALARQGTVFKNGFVTNALCLPSRASFLTGAYSHTTGATTNEEAVLPMSFPVVSDLLRQAGYETAFIGKSHVSGALLDHPWDYYFGFNGQANYLDPTVTERIGAGAGVTRTYHNTYVDDLLTDRAVAWLKGRASDKPFCLFLWFYAPHAPFYRPRRMLQRFNGVKIPIPADFDEDLTNYAGKARAVAEANNKIGTSIVFSDDARSPEELIKDHYIGVEANDENVGQVMDVLRAKKLTDDTAVLLSSDHGFFLGEHTFYDKRLMYEPSIRVPMVLGLPGRVKAQTRSEMVLNVDVAPTLLDLAGLPVPASMQGKSFMGLAEGRGDPAWRKDWLYEYYEYPGYENVKPHRGVRTERHKLIHFFTEPQEWELYDLAADPAEDRNLYGRPEVAELTARLKARLDEPRRETGDAYVYKPSRSPRPSVVFDPPGAPVQPWRPQAVEKPK
jgi:arylsulfatase A-like enzyme